MTALLFSQCANITLGKKLALLEVTKIIREEIFLTLS
jgi:hypothetical protein